MSKPDQTSPLNSPWKKYEILIFRIVFIYLIIQAVPLDWKYYHHLLGIDWLDLKLRDLFYAARYTPQFSTSFTLSGRWGIETFTDQIISLLIAVAGTAIWTFAGRKTTQYNNLYYWLRVIVRYRLAVAVIAYGFIKFFPVQEPYPSISNLNTNFGDFTDWKFFSYSLGIVPGYQLFLGTVEILAGILLLFRKTATVGAAIVFCFYTNVFLANIAYEGGEVVYSLYLILLAVFLLYYDVFRLFNLLALQKPTFPDLFEPSFNTQWLKFTRWALKGIAVLFLFSYSYLSYAASHGDGYRYPVTAGLKNASGVYNVSVFRINNKILPYAITDSTRWQDVVLEKWATLSIRLNRHIEPGSTNSQEFDLQDKDRDFELAGSARRQYYNYTADTVKHTLTLQNKNKNYPSDKLVLHYERPDTNKVILQGVNSSKDSIYVVLNKIQRTYILDRSVEYPKHRKYVPEQ